jgi:hypothetical protein
MLLLLVSPLSVHPPVCGPYCEKREEFGVRVLGALVLARTKADDLGVLGRMFTAVLLRVKPEAWLGGKSR